MNLKDLKVHFTNEPKGKLFKYGISEPFSWRGSYDEVAFSIINEPMTREEIIAKIEKALHNEFTGYNGGEYRYNYNTYVNFETDISGYSDGGYCIEKLAEITNQPQFSGNEFELIEIAFL